VDRLVIAISGPVSAGKSSVATALRRYLGAECISTGKILIGEFSGVGDAAVPRKQLQTLGEDLDLETKGLWVAAAVRRRLPRLRFDTILVVDAVRVRDQIEALRAIEGIRVLHIHVHAYLWTLKKRYEAEAAAKKGELSSYDDVRANKTEKRVHELIGVADLCLNTSLVPSVTVAGAFIVGKVQALRAWRTVVSLGPALAPSIMVVVILGSPFAWSWNAVGRPTLEGVIGGAALGFYALLLAASLSGQFSPVGTPSVYLPRVKRRT
jgi:chloramphenicol 3-O-phosphotransferase